MPDLFRALLISRCSLFIVLRSTTALDSLMYTKTTRIDWSGSRSIAVVRSDDSTGNCSALMSFYVQSMLRNDYLSIYWIIGKILVSGGKYVVKWEQTRIAIVIEYSSLVAFATRYIITVRSSLRNN